MTTTAFGTALTTKLIGESGHWWPVMADKLTVGSLLHYNYGVRGEVTSVMRKGKSMLTVGVRINGKEYKHDYRRTSRVVATIKHPTGKMVKPVGWEMPISRFDVRMHRDGHTQLVGFDLVDSSWVK